MSQPLGVVSSGVFSTNDPDHPVTRIKRRDGKLVPVDLNKIVGVINGCAVGLAHVDPTRVAVKTVGGIFDGATTRQLDELSITTATMLILEEPEYSKLAARLLARVIHEEAPTGPFSKVMGDMHALGRINDRTHDFVVRHTRALDAALDDKRDDEFEYFGLKTVYDRYLLRHPELDEVLETPQRFFMRIACALSRTLKDALGIYEALSTLRYLPGSPTLFNAGTNYEQCSSCFLVDSPQDNIGAIYKGYADVAYLSKFAGGIGIAYTRVRSRGSKIKSTNGKSNGIVPWLKILDSSIGAVNQCFAGDTLVWTSQGAKPIREIEAGNLILGHSGEYRSVLERFEYKQTEPMVRVKPKHSFEALHVTAGHPFYAITGVANPEITKRILARLDAKVLRPEWIEAKDLKAGDYVSQVIPQHVSAVEGFTREDARLYGIILGDGFCTKAAHEWGVAGLPDADHMVFVEAYLRAHDIRHFKTQMHGKAITIRWAKSGEVVRDAATGQYAGSGPDSLPFTRDDIYDVNNQKRIASRFMHLPEDQTLALIHGLIETDGNVSRGVELTYCTTSEPLAFGVRYLLLRLGIPTSGNRRRRVNDHDIIRDNGTVDHVGGITNVIDIRIPAEERIAVLAGCKLLTKRNWFAYEGKVWSRLREVSPAEVCDTVYDLKVERDETYTLASALVHNGGKRKGACAVYLEPWHADIEDFLELRNNTGDEASRTHNLNLVNWIPDLFMKRVAAGGTWSLFDPKVTPDLPDLYGAEFEAAYEAYEVKGVAVKTVPAQELYGKMIRTLAQFGQGWMTFKDRCNATSNQTGAKGNVIHLSNLCVEILQVSSEKETAVCNIGSINLSKFLKDSGVLGIEAGQFANKLEFDFDALADAVKTAVRALDRVIDVNFYTIPETAASNDRWRPVGLGLMGLQDVFFQLRLAFDSPKALELSNKISEEIYFHALTASCDLSEELGPHKAFSETKAAKGKLQFDAWNVSPSDTARWTKLRNRVMHHGLRNSLLIAIAPTATIASIAGCYECIEPMLSNQFKRETMSGDFLQVNRYLVDELRHLGVWNDQMRLKIKMANGSIQGITELPEETRKLFRTVWEYSMKTLINMAAGRGAFLDQSQSLNLFMESPSIGAASSMYMYAWQMGLKTTYYLRSRPATQIMKTVSEAKVEAPVAKKTFTEEEALVCSLENPDACEACQ